MIAIPTSGGWEAPRAGWPTGRVCGCMLMMYGASSLTGSVVGLVIAVVGTVVLVGRILGEEKMLLTELDGYDAYKQKVRYRLIPHVW